MSDRTALLVVDIQHDFLPGGALGVADGDAVLEPLRDLVVSGGFPLVVATQDWHPENHISFASHHPGRSPFDEISLYGHPQILWPDHCIQESRGAELHPSLPKGPLTAILRKGVDPEVDSYSAFRHNFDARGARPSTGLAGYLRERGVEELWIAGLARDFCVRWSAEDAADAGFDVHVLWHLTRPVNPASDGTVERAFEERGIAVEL